MTTTTRRKLSIFDATMIAEGDYEAAGLTSDTVTQDDVVDAWQLLIDTGVAWSLQGWFGRTAASMIEAGHCSPAGARRAA